MTPELTLLQLVAMKATWPTDTTRRYFKTELHLDRAVEMRLDEDLTYKREEIPAVPHQDVE